MELKKLNATLYVIYQRQGNDKNGNPVYIINFFRLENNNGLLRYYNVNHELKIKKDKHGNIKDTSYNINETINYYQCQLEGLTQ